MTRLVIASTPLQGLQLIQRSRFDDQRGFLNRLYCREEISAAGHGKSLSQINHTLTVGKGTVRGMHFQRPPHAETKIVTCIKGEIWDVAVDVRADSATYLQWHAEILSSDNNRSMLIPEGFAHGFQVLSDEAELLYLHTENYKPESEDGLSPLDTKLAISWPMNVSMLSDRDRSFHPACDNFKGVQL